MTKTQGERAENILKARAFNPRTRDEKRAEGIERNAAWASLSQQQKLHSLDGRLGKNTGAKRQRKLLSQR